MIVCEDARASMILEDLVARAWFAIQARLSERSGSVKASLARLQSSIYAHQYLLVLERRHVGGWPVAIVESEAVATFEHPTRLGVP